MSLVLDEIKEFKKIFIPWVYIFGVLTIALFSLGIKSVQIFGRTLYILAPATKTIAAEIFLKMKESLVPQGVEFIVTEPVAAFVVQIGVALVVSFVITSPLFFYRLMKYVSGALYVKERKALQKVLVPSAFLFAIGAAFAYFAILPPTFSVLYGYAGAIGAKAFFSVSDFALFTLGFTLACGAMFLLPVAMGILNSVGVTDRDTWKDNWRYAFLIFLVLSAIITPDGSGITMIMLSLPLTGLYFVGSVSGARRDGFRAGSNGRKPIKKKKK
jgi:sec-independent protein translocase protein TatC